MVKSRRNCAIATCNCFNCGGAVERSLVELGGCVTCPEGSPSSMIKHPNRRHGIDVRRELQVAPDTPSASARIDVAKTRDLVHDMVLRDLLPFSSSSTDGA